VQLRRGERSSLSGCRRPATRPNWRSMSCSASRRTPARPAEALWLRRCGFHCAQRGHRSAGMGDDAEAAVRLKDDGMNVLKVADTGTAYG
jgi:hypothetical protein